MEHLVTAGKIGSWTVEIYQGDKVAENFDYEAWLAKLMVKQWLSSQRNGSKAQSQPIAESE